MLTQKRKIGNLGEDVAEKYLKSKGYRILERNYRQKWGEIDIVAKFKNDVIFVEVKSRKSGADFMPAQNVTFHKQQRLIRAAHSWLKENKIVDGTPWQIDVVVVEIDYFLNKAKVEHLRNCVWM